MLNPIHQEKINQAAKLFESVLKESSAVYRANIDFTMSSPEVVIDFCKTKIAFSERENFLVLFLDNQHRLIEVEIMFQGTINATSIHPREIVKRALQLNAAAIVLSHNHPSGEVEASDADRHITHKIKQACELVDINVLDHVIVAPEAHLSFAKEFLM